LPSSFAIFAIEIPLANSIKEIPRQSSLHGPARIVQSLLKNILKLFCHNTVVIQRIIATRATFTFFLRRSFWQRLRTANRCTGSFAGRRAAGCGGVSLAQARVIQR
jgi:hypothetical protein